MRATALVVLVCAAIPVAVAASKKGAAAPPGPADLLARLEGCGAIEPCLERTAAIALDRNAPAATRDAAWDKLRVEVVRAKGLLLAAFPRVAADDQVRILEIIDGQFDLVNTGSDPALTELARKGLASGHAAVRLRAARFMAARNLPRISHHAIDAAEADPRLRVAALRAIENAREAKGARWIVARVADPEPTVRDQALRTLWVLGDAAAPFVREFLDADDARLRDAALEALLMVPSPDDYPRLQTWLEKHGQDDAALAERLTRVIAEMEANRYRPVPPAVQPLGF